VNVLTDLPILDGFRIEFAHRLSALSADQLDEFEETLVMMPEYELECLIENMRHCEEARFAGQEALLV
jgi:hypothetical protein